MSTSTATTSQTMGSTSTSSSATPLLDLNTESTTNILNKDNDSAAGPSTSASTSSSPTASPTAYSIPAPSTSNNTSNSKSENEEKKEESMFECNICLDQAKDDAVVSMCGHLFCWPCLHQWLETRPTRQLCPVCKAAISKEKVIPIYGRGSTNQEDPRTKVPPRPAGQRVEPEPGTGFQGFGFGDGGFHMSFGIGAFPFGFFTSSFNIGDNRPNAAQRGRPGWEEEQFLSKVFLWLAILFLTWLVLA